MLMKGDGDNVDGEYVIYDVTTGTENNQLNAAAECNLSPSPSNFPTANHPPNANSSSQCSFTHVTPCQVERPQPGSTIESNPSGPSSNLMADNDEISLLSDEGNSTGSTVSGASI